MIELCPHSFFRGISLLYIQDGYLLPETFRLDNTGRTDGYLEISITWNDELEAFDIIASQTSDTTDDIQFKGGIAEIQTKTFCDRMHPHIIVGNLDYERQPSKTNKYHGNILVKDSLNKCIKNMIKAQLALLAQENIRENPYA